MKTEPFGPHLIIDMYECNKGKLGNVDYIMQFLDSLPTIIGMTKITAPYVIRNENLIIGLVIIAESHISIHAKPEDGKAHIDIFSCKKFKVKQASNIIIKSFESKKYNINIVDRGIDFPKT